MKKQFLKYSTITIILFLLMLSLVSCNNIQPQEETGKSIMERITALDSVESVKIVDNNESKWLPEKYVVMVRQQIDWKNKDAGTFLQRVVVGIHPGAQVNILETNGYPFLDGEIWNREWPVFWPSNMESKVFHMDSEGTLLHSLNYS